MIAAYNPGTKFIYSAWAEDGTCLYVGQHTGIHPAIRIADHRSTPWYAEVARWDYEVTTVWLTEKYNVSEATVYRLAKEARDQGA